MSIGHFVNNLSNRCEFIAKWAGIKSRACEFGLCGAYNDGKQNTFFQKETAYVVDAGKGLVCRTDDFEDWFILKQMEAAQ